MNLLLVYMIKDTQINCTRRFYLTKLNTQAVEIDLQKYNVVNHVQMERAEGQLDVPRSKSFKLERVRGVSDNILDTAA